MNFECVVSVPAEATHTVSHGVLWKVVVAYNEHHYFVDNYWKGWRHDNWEAEFGVDQITGQMRKYKDRYEQSHPSKGFQYPVSHEWEIQATFLNFTTSPPNG